MIINNFIFSGNDLFCKEQIRRGQQIVHFIGKILASRDHGGYVVIITNDTGMKPRLFQHSCHRGR